MAREVRVYVDINDERSIVKTEVLEAGVWKDSGDAWVILEPGEGVTITLDLDERIVVETYPIKDE